MTLTPEQRSQHSRIAARARWSARDRVSAREVAALRTAFQREVQAADPIPCQVPECAQPVHRIGYCHMHYSRVYRNGSIEITRRSPGQDRDVCKVQGCGSLNDDGPHGYCRRHLSHIRRHGSTEPVPRGGSHSPNWSGDEASYRGAHKRVHRLRGTAKNHSCVRCSGTAQEWAYDNRDPNAKRQGALTYSLDSERYIPMCVACHRAFDAEERAHRIVPPALPQEGLFSDAAAQ